MPLTRIKQTAIGADAITTAKLDDTAGGLLLPGTQYVHVPVGTTAQRPSSPANGQLRYNTNFARLEQYANGQWQSIDTPPSITSLAYAGSLTGADPAGGETVTLVGSNFQAGALVTIGGTAATSVTVIGSTSITFTTPAKTAGDYDVVVTNANGLAATLLSGISYNGVPAFSTAAGNLGSLEEDEAMTTITIVAAEPDGGTLAYSITSGALPTGLSLGSANGQITGTPNVNPTADTTFTFTVTATDDENQTNSRQFNLIVLRPVYAHTLNESLRLHNNDSGSIERTQGTPTDGKIWTYAFWWRRGDSISESANRKLMIAINASNHQEDLRINTDNTLRWYSHNSSASAADSDLNFTRPLASTNDWHHICLVKDTTQATASNRAKLYIDGILQTQGSLSYPSLNYEGHVNKSGSVFHIGDKFQGTASGYYSDCYFVDGQALTPSSFTEVHNGILVPKAYSGTYGNNGFHVMGNDSVPRTTFTSGSMEFNGTSNASVNIVSGSINSNLSLDGQEYTIEMFIKPDALLNSQDYLLTIGTWNSVIHYALSYGTVYGLSMSAGNGWGWATDTFNKTGHNLDFDRWHHIAICGNDSTGVKRYYTNGVLTGSFTGENFPSNGLTNFYIGNYFGTNSWFDGKISNLRCVIGSQLYTGETYTIPSSTLTAVSGTQVLVGTDGTAADQTGNMVLGAGSGVTLNASDTIDVWEMYGAKDTSGNGNHMLVSDGGASSAASTARGAGTKITKSTNTPTSSYPTFVDNREYGAGYQAQISKAGTVSTQGGNATHNFLPVDITEFDPVGVYWEATCTTMDTSRTYAGIIGRSGNGLSVANSNGASYAFTDKVILNRNGSLYSTTATDGSGTTALTAYAANDTLMFAYKEGKFWIGKNGLWMNGGDPAAGTGNVGPADVRTQHSRGWQPYVGYNSKWEINMGSENGGFEYGIPTGFVPLSNNNRPNDDYINHTFNARQTKKFFNSVGWTGNGSSQAITGLGFQPDMVWIWGQNTTHASVYDSIRGATSGYYNRLIDFATNQEQVGGVITDSITSFDSDGFTVNSAGSGSKVNDTSDKYVATAWYIGGSATTNTDGDIQSSVIVNQDLGISIGTYTGNGQTSRQTIGHGLGEIPDMILAKKRTVSTGAWQCKMVDMEAASVNSTITPGQAGVRYDSVADFSGGGLAGLSTTTTFGVQGGTSNGNNLNQNTASNVFYAFAERTGFSKFSSYRGSGQTDGPYIPCGFKPEYVFLYGISNSSYGAYTFIPNAFSDIDIDGRGILYLEGNSNVTNPFVLIDSNGFMLTTSSSTFPAGNTAGNLYVFWAWASAPTKFATDQSTNWPN